MTQKERNLGWSVTLAGTGINLALGVLYTWSVISKSIPAEWGWSEFWRGFPYSVACLVFALMMVPAGRMQDKVGPRWVATMGGIFTGLGLILASRTTNVWLFTLGFGLLAGSGIGLGYASATPPAVKWFPPSKTGMIAGIVVSGFGLASAYISPLANFLIKRLGIQPSLLIFGGAFLVVVILLSQILIHVINKQSYGWTIFLHPSWIGLSQAALLVLLASLLSAYLPARQASGIRLTEALQYE